MKRVIAAGVAVIAVSAAGCGTTTIVRTVQVTRSARPSRHPQQAKTGDSLVLTGPEGERMRVTVQHVTDPIQGGVIDTPAPGTRFLGVFIKLSNIGRVPYSDSPGNGAVLISATGQQGQDSLLSGGICQSGFASAARIAPGEAEQGCIPFELPKSQMPRTFQFTLASGFANDTGEWEISNTSNGLRTHSGSGGLAAASSSATSVSSSTASAAPPESSSSSTSGPTATSTAPSGSTAPGSTVSSSTGNGGSGIGTG